MTDRRTAAADVEPYACHVCGRTYPSLAGLRVHAIVDERRVATLAERARSGQMELHQLSRHPATERSPS